MKKDKSNKPSLYVGLLGMSKLGIRAKLTGILLVVKIIPILLIAVLAFIQIISLADQLRDIAVEDSTSALNARAVENIERLTTDTAKDVADFLYERDADVRYAAKLYTSDYDELSARFEAFSSSRVGRMVKQGVWAIDGETDVWVRTDALGAPPSTGGGTSTNPENDIDDGFNYRDPDKFEYEKVYLYDEITFFDTNFVEKAKYVSRSGTGDDGTAVRAAKNLSGALYDLKVKDAKYGNYVNTFAKAEKYPVEAAGLAKNEIYVSDVTGRYVGSNFIGIYTPDRVNAAAIDRGYDIAYDNENQAFAGEENPNGKRFEGIVRWVTTVTDAASNIIGYVSLALNHDHIMEFVDRITPMDERYSELSSAADGNYAFIWDYQCRSICHPRHHSIYGFDDDGNLQVPWLETSIYNAWQASGYEYWYDYVTNENVKVFDDQSRGKKPAPELTKAGLVGLDGRYLNNAPQCTGWMDLTKDGGSGSFYILWSGLNKLTTAGAIPYYTGRYAPSAVNGNSLRGFGFVAIGAGLEDFTAAARATEAELDGTISAGLRGSVMTLALTAAGIVAAIAFIAVYIATSMTRSIKDLNAGMLRFRSGERQFRFNTGRQDEFGVMADSFDDLADGIEDSVKTAMSITDMDRNIIYMNESGLKLCGAALENIVGKPYGDYSIYPPDSEYCPISALHRGREAEVLFNKHSDKYLQGTADYLTDKDGKRIGYIIQSHDITEMVKQQKQTEQQRLLLDEIFSSSPDLIWYTDVKGVFRAINPRFASVIGLKIDDVVGKNINDILSDEQFAAFIVNNTAALISKKPLYSEEIVRFADGHSETLESVRTPIVGDDGEPEGLLGFARNITERVRIEHTLRQTQLELEKAVDAANNASQHKGDFLARMSHEIRTPLNAVIGITDIVLKRLDEAEDGNTDTQEIKSYMSQIDNSSKHLLGLLNDILDISKIEAGKIELSDEVISLGKLVNTVTSIIRPRCKEKNIRLKTEFDAVDPDCFKCDSLRLRQVLINLLGNAVKFTNELGIIEFKVSLTEDSRDKVRLRFSVRDTGIGIAKDAQAHVFEAFEQAGGSITRKYGGTGLGLAISRRIVQLFGGDITLVSEPGEGSEFSFEIWLERSDKSVEDDSEVKDISGMLKDKRILLVDDVDVNRMIVRAMLEETEAVIDEANDGQLAIDAFAASPLFYYDIVLMDIKMPNVDGYEAASVIRKMDRPDASAVPIIALTANAFKDDIEQALARGMNAHISKPVESAVLYSTLIRYLNPRGQ